MKERDEKKKTEQIKGYCITCGTLIGGNEIGYCDTCKTTEEPLKVLPKELDHVEGRVIGTKKWLMGETQRLRKKMKDMDDECNLCASGLKIATLKAENSQLKQNVNTFLNGNVGACMREILQLQEKNSHLSESYKDLINTMGGDYPLIIRKLEKEISQLKADKERGQLERMNCQDEINGNIEEIEDLERENATLSEKLKLSGELWLEKEKENIILKKQLLDMKDNTVKEAKKHE